ncbi:hypothetical protein IQ254_12165 [Nodosilinea sp. LEGE 07088]|uniref:hypothetical protein n=1 Tax=Nodosilinea sp. LEGE 07088 TaxID=2777968 RepID=UPI00187E758D|nr:hypothetical protein [Nodosilinea sp. LEGE 07088]MBE9137938.1 hypothetical protein [Nodosilinea sp. LEGE 07088]
MSHLLLVPIQVDALHLKFGTGVAESMAAPNRLPYFSGKRDVNPDTVNLSESIVSQPFQNKNLHLKAGVHLHWSLPDALTQEIEDGQFPAVPNRWLVTRRMGAETEHWVVESDYLHSPSVGFREDSVMYPYADPTEPNLPAFRYLGRTLTLEEWKQNQQASSADDKHLERLTAIGYGEPTFAAFYPNCRSVFGFHDSKYADATALPEGLQYDVIGWYSNAEQNYLSEFIQDFQKNFKADFPEEELTLEALMNSVQEEFKWKFEWENETFPQNTEAPQILCYARLTFQPPADYSGQPPLETANIRLAVANTGTEALSAYLADTIDKPQKAVIEEQLEALQFADDLESQQLDIGPKFQEIRHEAGFNAVAGNFLWKIRINTQTQPSSSDPSSSNSTASQTKLDLPADIAAQLNALNQQQQIYDEAIVEVDSRRRQLFSDWYKYMICAYPPEDSQDDYPDIDEVKYYIQQRGLEPLLEKSHETGTLDLNNPDSLEELSSGSEISLASELAREINDLVRAIDRHNQALQDKYNALDDTEKEKTSQPPTYQLELVSGPRYWEPKEPVVLMEGDAVAATQRHGEDGRLSEDGLLECQVIADQTIQDLIAQDFKSIFETINQLNPQGKQERIGFNLWTAQPWNPILLEWLVEVFPVAEGGNKTSANRKYSDDFLTRNYMLQTNDIDLSPKSDHAVVEDAVDNRIKTDQDSNIYSGYSILTPYANSLLQQRIEAYLQKHKTIETYYQEQNIAPDQQNIELLAEQIDDVERWYANKTFSDPIYTAIKAYQELQSLNCLSQCIGGFNDALLMQKQTLQLDLEDPIGFADYQAFTAEVAAAIDGETESAPQPLDDFSPIRSGELRIIDLQLVDTFGQVRNLDWQVDSDEYVIRPEPMKTAENNRIKLPPRFVQPTRINFRWLSANDVYNRETTDDPNTTPICGWILPNNLNGGLTFYDNAGQALGVININGEWDDVPGETTLATTVIEGQEIPNIANPHLHKMVKTIITSGREFVENFNLCLNDALNNIDPENFAQNQSLALLMGRPIAVVRAAVNLELQGLPAINQDWIVFRQDMQQMRSLEQRDTDDLTEVKVPIRIGEYRQLNDGVIGYWKEQPSADGGYEYENDIFYAQQSKLNESDKIETQAIDRDTNPDVEEGPINIIQSISSPPQLLTMLVDPRGSVHATAGILPSKVITIPPEQYAEALANIKVTFSTTPILTERTQQGRLYLPLPTAPDYDWVWLEQKGRDTWSEILTTPAIEKAAFVQSYAERTSDLNLDPDSAWQDLLAQEWLISRPASGSESSPSKAHIADRDKREALTGALETLDDLIDQIFESQEISINPVSSQATFLREQEIREGWLVLNPSQS